MSESISNENPFLNDIEIETKDKRRTIIRGEQFLTNGERREEAIHSIQEVDKEKFVKIFISKIRILFDLSLTGNKLFYIFLYSISDTVGKDRVYMNYETAVKIAEKCDFNLSNPVFYRGMNELIEKRIIAKSKSKYIYYINPRVIFNGDRAKFVEELRVKKENDENKTESQDKEDELDDLEKQIQKLKERKRMVEEKQKSVESVNLDDLPDENIKKF